MMPMMPAVSPLAPELDTHGRTPPQKKEKERPSIFHNTKMCKFNLLGACTRGKSCIFAHTKAEMKPLPDLYRTKLCKSYMSGACKEQDCMFRALPRRAAHARGDEEVGTADGRGQPRRQHLDGAFARARAALPRVH